MSSDVEPKSGIPDSLLRTLRANSESHFRPGDEELETGALKPDGAWNYRSQRSKLNHLIKAPPSHSGQVGSRDISFLQDKANMQQGIEDSIIPKNFHVIKSSRVIGLDAKSGPYRTTLEDGLNRLRVFPSLQPNRRVDAVMLNEAMDKMLEELIASPKTNAAGEGQRNQGHIHDVLDTIKKEQDIYDVVFYEIIRQVTVDCKERGQLLSKLRKAYADLLGKIPSYVGGIHSELIAQRVLDGKLTSQILFFKREIDRLGAELAVVRDHDRYISEEAEASKKELEYAMSESAKSAAVLEEYHQLYELQRERLQKQLKKVSAESEVWNSAAYSLAIKLVDENKLSVARRIYVSERAWSKLARHFSVFLAERDSNDLNRLQLEVHKWRETASNLKRLSETKNNKAREIAKELFQELAGVMDAFKKKFIYIDFAGGRRVKEPDLNSADQLIEDFEFVTIKLGKFIHTFDNSDPMAGKCGKYLEDMEQRLNNWTDNAIEIYSRHRSPTDQKHPQHNVMTDLNEKIICYHNQMADKNIGENGIVQRASTINTGLNLLKAKIGQDSFNEEIWLDIVDTADGFIDVLSDVIQFIGNLNGAEEPVEKEVSSMEAFNDVTKWMRTSVDGIEAENSKITALIDTLSNDQLLWMSSCLVNLVPDKPNCTLLREISCPVTASPETLVADQQELSDRCLDLTNYLEKCVIGLVLENTRINTQQQRLREKADVESNFSEENFENFESSEISEEPLPMQEAPPILDDLPEPEMPEEEGDNLELQMKAFKEESLEWERSAVFFAEALQTLIDEKGITDSPSLTLEKGKLNTIDYDFKEAEGHFARDLYVVSGNENITVRDVDRQEGTHNNVLSSAKTDESENTLSALGSVEVLQQELILSEERALRAEEKVEELEAILLAIRQKEAEEKREAERSPEEKKKREEEQSKSAPPKPPIAPRIFKPTTTAAEPVIPISSTRPSSPRGNNSRPNSANPKKPQSKKRTTRK